MRGRVILMGAVVALSATACHWNVYEATHIHVVEMNAGIRQAVKAAGGPDDRAGYAIGVAIGTGDIALDTNCADDGICIDSLGAQYAELHEEGHIIARDLGFPWGSSDVEQEQQANCFAELAQGHGPSVTWPDQGYWDCPQERVDSLYALMVQRGMAEYGDFPLTGGN